MGVDFSAGWSARSKQLSSRHGSHAKSYVFLMSNSTNIFESTRSFVVFSYSASHGLLLLRSRKTNTHPTRIDVLLQDVRAMEMRSWFDGIQIEEVNQEYLEGRSCNPGAMIETGNKVYAVHGANWDGFIVGGRISVQEDDGDYMAPSLLLGSTGL